MSEMKKSIDAEFLKWFHKMYGKPIMTDDEFLKLRMKRFRI